MHAYRNMRKYVCMYICRYTPLKKFGELVPRNQGSLITETPMQQHPVATAAAAPQPATVKHEDQAGRAGKSLNKGSGSRCFSGFKVGSSETIDRLQSERHDESQQFAMGNQVYSSKSGNLSRTGQMRSKPKHSKIREARVRITSLKLHRPQTAVENQNTRNLQELPQRPQILKQPRSNYGSRVQ